MMAMDNLDTAFHTPRYVEEFSASFYEQASRICHEHGARSSFTLAGGRKPTCAASTPWEWTAWKESPTLRWAT